MRVNFALNAYALRNISLRLIPAGVDQPVMSWSNTAATSNILYMLVDEETSQSGSGWLKLFAC